MVLYIISVCLFVCCDYCCLLGKFLHRTTVEVPFISEIVQIMPSAIVQSTICIY